ncbi:MAG TPA: beta-ketoacyl-ACP synthase III [Gemmatimonadales bacterium]|nr:beta-ketoacyl-ACP synthase III [Gemmatimonadales bacterium]
MPRTEFIATGMYVPDRVVKNDEFTQWMETSDEWIRTRTGIEERRWVAPGQGGADMAFEATQRALARASLKATDLDAIVYCTLSPDYFFPGTGVFLQRLLGVTDIPCLDVRNQCTGFLYGLSIADAWIRTGQYKRVLLVGSEVHSTGMDLTTRGRDLAVLFGDGAGVAILGPTEAGGRGVLSTHIFADGRYAEMLFCDAPASSRRPRLSQEDLDTARIYPRMEGKEVFKHASTRMPESVLKALEVNGLAAKDIKVLIPHQANLRISEMVRRQLDLREDQVFNNIQRYGNTTAGSIPIALDECVSAGKLARGDLLLLAAFGSGFTWGSAAIRW